MKIVRNMIIIRSDVLICVWLSVVGQMLAAASEDNGYYGRYNRHSSAYQHSDNSGGGNILNRLRHLVRFPGESELFSPHGRGNPFFPPRDQEGMCKKMFSSMFEYENFF